MRTSFTLLHKLPKDHPLRNRKLGEGAFYRFPHEETKWMKVNSKFAIADKTYNELGTTWQYNHFTFDNPNE